eukprot:TRINITY_DN94796_c0_g1_i1.p1 TRINITY_DN94796_c0_g1~~TRINITY_DN94796_c0_g1_i1.p1  ORF type:complete len:327 (+),score=101.10 TRINITY_DN94796_c0_g1_i1:84-1064(+)
METRTRGSRSTVLLLLISRLCDAFCPKGFGNAEFFPREWKIPVWPQDLPIEKVSGLRTVTLGGFAKKDLNEEYLEGPNDEFIMQGHETYWQASGKYFMYYCQRFRKWRISALSGFGENMEGNCLAFVSDGIAGRDIRNESLIKGWIEVEDAAWVPRHEAGVVALGTLGDQMDEDVEEGDCPYMGNGTNKTDGEEVDKSKCPVMPTVRKVKKKVTGALKAAGKWMRRLFPDLLAAPDDEDAIPEDEDGSTPAVQDAPEGSCDPEDLDSCNFKEKFYIQKQKGNTPEQRQQELERLAKMQGVVMKPEQKQWMHIRMGILKKLASRDEL